jgi:hypothetical protein
MITLPVNFIVDLKVDFISRPLSEREKVENSIIIDSLVD